MLIAKAMYLIFVAMDKEVALSAIQLIKNDLSAQREFDESQELTFHRLLDWLTAEVQYLLNHNFGQLLNALYRIDLAESEVSQLLEKGDPDQMATNLANAILEREIKKAETRLKYKGW